MQQILLIAEPSPQAPIFVFKVTQEFGEVVLGFSSSSRLPSVVPVSEGGAFGF